MCDPFERREKRMADVCSKPNGFQGIPQETQETFSRFVRAGRSGLLLTGRQIIILNQ